MVHNTMPNEDTKFARFRCFDSYSEIFEHYSPHPWIWFPFSDDFFFTCIPFVKNKIAKSHGTLFLHDLFAFHLWFFVLGVFGLMELPTSRCLFSQEMCCTPSSCPLSRTRVCVTKAAQKERKRLLRGIPFFWDFYAPCLAAPCLLWPSSITGGKRVLRKSCLKTMSPPIHRTSISLIRLKQRTPAER